MKLILNKWILKSKPCLEEHLCPLRMLSICKDPPFVILCLNDKDTKSRNQDVINLSCPIMQFQRDVI